MKKAVVVTGGTRGIGGAVSKVLFEAGWHVIAATVSEEASFTTGSVYPVDGGYKAM